MKIFRLLARFTLPVLLLTPFLLTTCHEREKPQPPEKNEPPVETSTPLLSFSVVRTYPHDTNSFTEGFLFHDNELYESTGATGNLPQTKSLFGTVDLNTGKIHTKAELDRNKYFGEGIVFLNGKVYQLTYTTQVGFIYDAKTFQKIREFAFPNKEGWGMTTDGKRLIMSDGTNVITYWDPNTIQTVKTLPVSENGFAVDYLNELELIHGALYANIWTTNSIVKIDTATGKVLAKLDLSPLAEEARKIYRGAAEMNGIAYDPGTDKIFVTGKMWPKIYEVKFDH